MKNLHPSNQKIDDLYLVTKLVKPITICLDKDLTFQPVRIIQIKKSQ